MRFDWLISQLYGGPGLIIDGLLLGIHQINHGCFKGLDGFFIETLNMQ
jgi:hypothetical protein